MNLKVLTANLLWFLYSAVRTRTWRNAIRNVEVTQQKLLLSLLAKNAETEFGRKHFFARIESAVDFQRAVPIQTYEDLQPYIDKIATGTSNVLTADRVQRFGVSSGSTKASKLVPYTSSLIADFQEGIDPWMYHLMRDNPQIMAGRAYWSVTPIGERQTRSNGNIPIGFDDERSYFGRLTQWVLGTVMVTPSELAMVSDMNAFRYATLRFLLQEKSISWVSIWNPTFAILFLNPLKGWFDKLIKDVREGTMSVDLGVAPEIGQRIRRMLKCSPKRARELERIKQMNDNRFYESIWPKLRLISCWAHGNSAEAVKQLRGYFPNVAIQPKGLIATEAFVSFPLREEASALSVNSHFFEFEEVDSKTVLLAHQLHVGRRYSVIVTTSGGLYRYRLNDMIEVLGHEDECPLIRFIGKQNKVVDLCGEKLNEEFVRNLVMSVVDQLRLSLQFWMVAPERNGDYSPFYTLFVQSAEVNNGALQVLQREIEVGLRENFHYDYCRRLGQLQALRVFVVEKSTNAHETYLSVCTERGQRLGDIKPSALHSFEHWSMKFRGRFIQ